VEAHNILQDLHNRFLLQAYWTAENRKRLYASVKIHQASRVLEVGSGTGAILHELTKEPSLLTHGIDIDPEAVSFARNIDPNSIYAIGDGFHLPYAKNSFDVTLCHFLLMWVSDPLAVLREMGRVTKSPGAVLALAEPDYGGRIDFPESLETLGQQQAQALENQGANTQIGRKLRMFFSQAGFVNIHTGVLGGEWYGIPDKNTLNLEWKTLTSDLQGRISEEELEEYHRIEQEAWNQGYRMLYVPTFYALGWIPA
jgi:ubiquinone/menaquinone biosynthesis C-methylase UbiE